MGIYQALGLRPIINAHGHLTKWGGSRMPPAVVDAMAAASQSYIDVYELQQRAGQRVAELTSNHAAYICSGAAAGVFLATMACMTGPEIKAVAKLPRLDGLKRQVIVHRTHRIPVDMGIFMSGATVIEIGNVIETMCDELEANLGPETAAVLYVAGEEFARGAVSLEETITIAHKYGIPVIVDAASQLPPASNLWYFSRELGADLVIFSGGKELCGPQASGLIVGRRDLIRACFLNGSPHARMGRPMKTGKEQVLGLLAAVEWYLAQDETDRKRRCDAVMDDWLRLLVDVPGVSGRRLNEKRIAIRIAPQIIGLSSMEIQRLLFAGDPPIAVGADPARSEIHLTPYTLDAGEEQIVSNALSDLLGRLGRVGR